MIPEREEGGWARHRNLVVVILNVLAAYVEAFTHRDFGWRYWSALKILACFVLAQLYAYVAFPPRTAMPMPPPGWIGSGDAWVAPILPGDPWTQPYFPEEGRNIAQEARVFQCFVWTWLGLAGWHWLAARLRPRASHSFFIGQPLGVRPKYHRLARTFLIPALGFLTGLLLAFQMDQQSLGAWVIYSACALCVRNGLLAWELRCQAQDVLDAQVDVEVLHESAEAGKGEAVSPPARPNIVRIARK